MLIVQGQQKGTHSPSNAVPGQLWVQPVKKWYAHGPRYFNISQQLMQSPQQTTPLSVSALQRVQKLTTTPFGIRDDHYTKHFGFFCRQELQLEKAAGLPLRFRLGSVKDCDYLEGK